MNAIDVKKHPRTLDKIARVLRGVFHETVLQLALFVGVVVALVDGATSLGGGTIV